MKYLFLVPLFVLALALPSIAADPYKVGSKVASFSAVDQHGEAYSFGPETKYLIVSFAMESGKAANQALEKKGAGYLGPKKAVYMANIYGMPGIGRFFAFKAMKKYPHRIVYADDENLLTPYPQEEGKVTVLSLDSSGKIRKITFWTPGTQDLDAVLK